MSRRFLTVCLVAAVALAACGRGDGGEDTRAGDRAPAGTWRTWVLPSASAVEVPPPPEGRAREDERRELADLASRRTGEMVEKARHWDQAPANKPWVDLNLELVAAGVKDPPLASRGYALTNVAIYDAAVAAWHWKHVYDQDPPRGVPRLANPGFGPSYPSEHAAIAGAASRVLAHLFPDRPAARFELLAEEAAMSRVWAGANYRSDVEAGLKLGRAVGDAIVADAEGDGSARPWDGSRPPGIGHGPQFWEPPPGRVTPPTQPLAGTWDTWVLSSGSQLRPPPPPAYGSPEFVADCKEVMAVRANLTPEQKEIAKFWEGGQGTGLPPGLWNEILFTYVRAAEFDTPSAARAFALLNVAVADAGVAVWDAKFAYWSPRPVNAIRSLGLDQEWTPFLSTPPFPSYVSGHAGYSGAASEVLAYLFPAGAAEFRVKAEEAAVSRLYGGIHYRVDNDVGLRMGREVGRLVVERAKRDGSKS
ncbi:MAG TPA: phosphatase PAP2 family protein [Acidimicrobiales bacterium]|nr:phosphatase PAP2 family protein [Acidimicrobiales bacterium]